MLVLDYALVILRDVAPLMYLRVAWYLAWMNQHLEYKCPTAQFLLNFRLLWRV